MTTNITISAPSKREHIFNELMKRDVNGVGLSAMLGIAAQYYVEQEGNICLLPTIASPPEDLREYASTCDAEAYKELTQHSIVLNNILRKEDTYHRRL